MSRARAAWWPVAVIALLAVGLPVLDAALSGAYDVPRNDDWAFSRIAADLFDHGRLRLLDWNEMTLVGLFAWSAPLALPFGAGLEVLRASTAVAAVVALGAAWVLARRRLAPDRAVVAVLTLAVMAPFAVLVTEYLTDVPALALSLVCLAAGAGALAAPAVPAPLLAASLAAGAWAFTIRDTALAAPVGVLAGLAVHDARGGRGLRRAAVVAGALLVPCAVFWVWRRGLDHGGGAPSETTIFLGSAMRAGQALTTLGALAAPALVASVPALARRGRPAALGAAAGLGLVAFVLVAKHHYDEPQSLLTGNALLRAGELGGDVLAGSRPEAMPGALWTAVEVLAAGGTAILGGWVGAGVAALRRGRPRAVAAVDPGDVALVVAGALTLGAVLVRAATIGAVFDRYLMLPALVAALLALRARPAPRPGAPVVAALSVLAAATTLLVLNAHAFADARWRAGERLVALGPGPADVDAGFEWMGLHHPGPALAPPGAPAAGAPDTVYHADFPGSRNCLLAAASPLTDRGLRPAGTLRWTAWPGHRATLRLYRNARC